MDSKTWTKYLKCIWLLLYNIVKPESPIPKPKTQIQGTGADTRITCLVLASISDISRMPMQCHPCQSSTFS